MAISEAKVSEGIATPWKRAAVALSETLDYALAAKCLDISIADLKKQVADLEDHMCLRIFDPRSLRPELTDEGRFLVGMFREALSVRDEPKA